MRHLACRSFSFVRLSQSASVKLLTGRLSLAVSLRLAVMQQEPIATRNHDKVGRVRMYPHFTNFILMPQLYMVKLRYTYSTRKTG